MKKNLKVYFISIMIAFGFNMIPVILNQLRIVYKLDLLHVIAIIVGVFSILLVIIFVMKSVENLLPRVVIILLNPSLIYTILLIIAYILLVNNDWENLWKIG